MGKAKKVTRGQIPIGKETRSTKENQRIIENAFQKNPVWQLTHVDMEHDEWGWKNLEKNDPGEILQKFRDKDKKRDHPITVNNLTSVRDKKATGDRHCEERSDSGYQEPQAKPQESCQGLLTVTKIALLPLDCRAPYGGSQ
jgi:hypothetical protein